MGADICLKDNDGLNYLHIAALCGHLHLCKILKDKHNFDVNMADESGRTTLHYSVRYGSYELFTYFADMGADIYLKDNEGWDCLHIAAIYEHWNFFEILKDKHNFDVYMADKDGWMALHHSARCGSYPSFTYFVDMGADIYLKNNDGQNCLHIAVQHGNLNLCKILKDKHKFDVHMADKVGWTSLHHSAKLGSYNSFTYFVDMGADIYLKDNDGQNCLHITAEYGHLNLCKSLKDKRNFDVHMADKQGWEALHYSALNSSYDLFTYFVDMGADIYLKDNDGRNCLHIPAQYGHLKLCKFLKDKHNFDVHMAKKN